MKFFQTPINIGFFSQIEWISSSKKRVIDLYILSFAEPASMFYQRPQASYNIRFFLLSLRKIHIVNEQKSFPVRIRIYHLKAFFPIVSVNDPLEFSDAQVFIKGNRDGFHLIFLAFSSKNLLKYRVFPILSCREKHEISFISNEEF